MSKDSETDLFKGYKAAVKILVTEQSPDWINPWQTRTAHRRMGSGTPLDSHNPLPSCQFVDPLLQRPTTCARHCPLMLRMDVGVVDTASLLMGTGGAQPNPGVCVFAGVLIARKGEPFPGGKGELAEGHIILTAAHVIANSTFIQVQLSDSPERHLAEVSQVRRLWLHVIAASAYLRDTG